MGELLLCSEQIAGMPYYIEGVGLNVYSLEELSYYISHNVYLIDRSFMSSELCTWMREELHADELAETLEKMMDTGAKLSGFVELLLRWTGYCREEEINEIQQMLVKLENKSEFECRRLRADRLTEKEKYTAAIWEYRNLLGDKAAENEKQSLIGDIWHNLAFAYAGMFLFDTASECYEKAYRLNGRKESLRECLIMHLCRKDEEAYRKTAAQYEVREEELEKLQEEISAVKNDGEMQKFSEKINELAQMTSDGQKERFQENVKQMIFEWKEDYRKKTRN